MSGSESEKDWGSSDGEQEEAPQVPTGLPRVTPEPQSGGRGMARILPKHVLERQMAQQKEPKLAAWTGPDPWEGEDPFGGDPRGTQMPHTPGKGELSGASQGGKGREPALGMENGKGGGYATWQTGCSSP